MQFNEPELIALHVAKRLAQHKGVTLCPMRVLPIVPTIDEPAVALHHALKSSPCLSGKPCRKSTKAPLTCHSRSSCRPPPSQGAGLRTASSGLRNRLLFPEGGPTRK